MKITFISGYDDLTQGQDYKSSAYSTVSQSGTKSGGSSSGHAGVSNNADLQMNTVSAYSKTHAQVTYIDSTLPYDSYTDWKNKSKVWCLFWSIQKLNNLLILFTFLSK